ncbi:MAG TPA: glycosyltransferase family 2 protein [Gemmataceae bacterium]|jgi:cellulose synthase/poly-beta-1,6-N-acetylglucosamine synthase-like glycosyltransferase
MTESPSRPVPADALPAGLKLSVVIPVYNERRWLAEVVRRVEAVPVPKEIVVVDDGSTDGTRDLLRELAGRPGVRAFYQPRNRGKGAALRVGFKHATGDVVLVQDADLEYDPADYRGCSGRSSAARPTWSTGRGSSASGGAFRTSGTRRRTTC